MNPMATTVRAKQTSSQNNDAFDELLAEISQQLHEGAAVDLEGYCRRHPAWADSLKQLLPAIEALADLGLRPTDEPRADDPLANKDRCESGVLGDYRILREVGRGGMGVVYEAEQISLKRTVAVKVLPFAAVLDQRQLQRFKNEAQAAATLNHPNIVGVHAVGCERGVHYYAMQYIEGQTLAEVIRDLRAAGGTAPEQLTSLPAGHTDSADAVPASTPAPAAESTPAPASETARALQAAISTERTGSMTLFHSVAQLGIQAAEALDHAHAMGIVHRDIKPSNLMIDHRDALWVTDFGLAQIESDNNLTLTGDLLGTLRYMSPEQLSGHRVLDHRTDIYSLGVTLYELLTLRPAFPEKDRNQLLRQIAETEPAAPRKLNSAIPVDLETIVLKAISKSAVDRYATAQELADDLQRFLASKPVQARRPGLVQHVGKWTRRNWVPLTLVAVTLLMAFSVGMLIIGQAFRSERSQRQLAEQEKAAAVASLNLALHAVDKMYSEVATQWLATDTTLMPTRRAFLEDALSIYEQVVQRPATGRSSRVVVARTYFRIGRIHERLGKYADARQAFEIALSIQEELHRESSPDNKLRADHAALLRYLAEMHRSLGDFVAARNALDRAQPLMEVLVSDFPKGEYKKILALLEFSRASVDLSLGHLADADRLTKSARQHFRQLVAANPGIGDLHFNENRCDDLLAEVLFQQGLHREALSQSHAAIASGTRLRLEYPESPGVVQLEGDMHKRCGVIHLALDEFAEAVKHFQRSLASQRATLEARTSPAQWCLQYVLKEEFRERSYQQPGRFFDYINTQLLLAAALRELGRSHEAELVLGEAHQISQVMTNSELEDPRDQLRFRVAWANSSAELAKLLSTRRADEAARARMEASALWQDALEKFPQAAEFRSGAHGLQADLEWFQSAFSDEDVRAAEPLQAVELGHDSVFYLHNEGVMLLEAELWQRAITRFKKAAALRNRDHAYDWLNIAMASWQLGEHDEARQWFDKATQAMQTEPSSDSELEALRDRAAALLNQQVDGAGD